MTPHAAAARTRAGALYAVAAYGLWGLTPIYWHALGEVGTLEIICHRALWSTVFVLAMIGAAGKLGELVRVATNWRTLGALVVSGSLVMGNWYVFIWAVQRGYVLETSLGYYINPLVSVLLGVLFLGDRMGPLRIAAVALATVAVLYLTWSLGVAPWLALFLAITFGLYGLVRKLVPVDPLVGLAIETGIAAPLAIAWIVWAGGTGQSHFLVGGFGFRDMMLMGAGLITALPLVWFAAAASRLSLSSVGFFQYIAPTLNFLIAVFVFGEAFTHAHMVAFTLIWTALMLVSYEAVRTRSA
jgi:chloramphenicol-sensitive protein RarD